MSQAEGIPQQGRMGVQPPARTERVLPNQDRMGCPPHWKTEMASTSQRLQILVLPFLTFYFLDITHKTLDRFQNKLKS